MSALLLRVWLSARVDEPFARAAEPGLDRRLALRAGRADQLCPAGEHSSEQAGGSRSHEALEPVRLRASTALGVGVNECDEAVLVLVGANRDDEVVRGADHAVAEGHAPQPVL